MPPKTLRDLIELLERRAADASPSRKALGEIMAREMVESLGGGSRNTSGFVAPSAPGHAAQRVTSPASSNSTARTGAGGLSAASADIDPSAHLVRARASLQVDLRRYHAQSAQADPRVPRRAPEPREYARRGVAKRGRKLGNRRRTPAGQSSLQTSHATQELSDVPSVQQDGQSNVAGLPSVQARPATVQPQPVLDQRALTAVQPPAAMVQSAPALIQPPPTATPTFSPPVQMTPSQQQTSTYGASSWSDFRRYNPTTEQQRHPYTLAQHGADTVSTSPEPSQQASQALQPAPANSPLPNGTFRWRHRGQTYIFHENDTSGVRPRVVSDHEYQSVRGVWIVPDEADMAAQGLPRERTAMVTIIPHGEGSEAVRADIFDGKYPHVPRDEVIGL